MKKVRFGSFPLVEVPKQDRRCLDKYLIKNFSDNISISDAMRNLNITKNLLYITPDSLISDWLTKSSSPSGPQSSRSKLNGPERDYDKTLKRAFFILKEFYKNVSNKPFYREYIYYPIYIERIASFDTEQNTVMNYSFIVLSNDLDKEVKIDEIRYDSNATLNFLFLFTEFFGSGEDNQITKKSLNDINSKDMNFLVRFYQFIEKSDKQPIDVINDLYKFLSVLDKLGTDKNKAQLEINKYFKDTKIDAFKKYQGVMKGGFMANFEENSKHKDDKFRDSFMKMMNAMFDQSGFLNLFGDISDTSLSGRKQVVYNSNKYQEILNLSRELIEYNKIGVNEIIINDKIEFDFKLESGGYTIETQSQVLVQKYQDFFKKFIDEIKSYIDTTLKETLDQESKAVIQNMKENDAVIKLQKDFDFNVNERDSKNKELLTAQKEYNHIRLFFKTGVAGTTQAEHDEAQERFRELTADINRLTNEINQHDMNIKGLDIGIQQLKQMPQVASTFISKEILNSANDEILQGLSGDLAFLYEDIKDLFRNESLVQQIIDSPINNTADFNAIKNGTNTNSKNSERLKELLETLEVDFETIGEGLYNQIRDKLLGFENALSTSAQDFIKAGESKFSKSFRTKLIDSFTSDDNRQQYIDLYSQAIKSRAIGTILKNVQRLFNKKRYKHEIRQSDKISELHPLIKKMLKNPQNFRAFIIDFDIIENLYNMWFATATKKFLAGLNRRMPQKLSSPKNRMEFVIENLLGLDLNPVWILSKTKIYLSMPDYLSLTKTKLLEAIDKADIQEVCRIDYKDYWNENKMGQMNTFVDTNAEEIVVSDAQSDLDAIGKRIDDNTSTDKGIVSRLNKDKTRAESKLKLAKEKLSKAKKKQDARGNAIPNLFGVEHEPLLNDAERKDLMKDKIEVMDGAQLPQKSFEDSIADKIELDMDELLKDSADKANTNAQQYEPPKAMFDANGNPIVQPTQPIDPLEQRDQRTR